jgi:DNA polymerase III sliding clamp (beta) subunit (PCNA family)
MSNYILNANELEAVSLCASKEATRYYLCGVCVEVNQDDTIALIATDGYRMAAIRYSKDAATKDSFIISNDDIKKVLTLYKGECKTAGKIYRDNLVISIDHADDNLTLSIVMRYKDETPPLIKASFTTKAVDGNFPDYRRVLPARSGTVGAISFNAVYMADFARIANLLDDNAHIVCEFTDKDSLIIITLPKYTEFTGILMPIRL